MHFIEIRVAEIRTTRCSNRSVRYTGGISEDFTPAREGRKTSPAFSLSIVTFVRLFSLSLHPPLSEATFICFFFLSLFYQFLSFSFSIITFVCLSFLSLFFLYYFLSYLNVSLSLSNSPLFCFPLCPFIYLFSHPFIPTSFSFLPLIHSVSSLARSVSPLLSHCLLLTLPLSPPYSPTVSSLLSFCLLLILRYIAIHPLILGVGENYLFSLHLLFNFLFIFDILVIENRKNDSFCNFLFFH
ncbi:unnamed protein product [Acanthosepion pharaonis]|uniref:Uncharacterized protein n=1 Tax=Acanthosepion pharaonis TaxID=158019 RepID=A0A812BFU8_ACAPH|nr:unnamed protein product [Sepia pharaonis]